MIADARDAIGENATKLVRCVLEVFKFGLVHRSCCQREFLVGRLRAEHALLVHTRLSPVGNLHHELHRPVARKPHVACENGGRMQKDERKEA